MPQDDFDKYRNASGLNWGDDTSYTVTYPFPIYVNPDRSEGLVQDGEVGYDDSIVNGPEDIAVYKPDGSGGWTEATYHIEDDQYVGSSDTPFIIWVREKVSTLTSDQFRLVYGNNDQNDDRQTTYSNIYIDIDDFPWAVYDMDGDPSPDRAGFENDMNFYGADENDEFGIAGVGKRFYDFASDYAEVTSFNFKNATGGTQGGFTIVFSPLQSPSEEEDYHKYLSIGSAGNHLSMYLQMSPDNTIQGGINLETGVFGGDDFREFDTGVTPNENDEYIVTLNFYNGDTFELWVNGEYKGIENGVDNPIKDTDTLRIARNMGDSQYTSIDVGHVEIHDEPRTPEVIQAQHAAHLPDNSDVSLLEWDVAQTFSVAYSRTVDEVAALFDSVNQSTVFEFYGLESLGFNDAVSSTKDYVRSVADTLGVSGALTKSTGYVKNLAEAVGVAAAITFTTAYIKSLSENVSVSETISTTKTVLKVLDEQIGLSSAVSRILSISRTLNENTKISDSLTSFAEYIKSLNEAVKVNDALSIETLYKIVQNEVTALNDTFSETTSYVRQIAENIGVTANSIVKKIIPVVLDEAFSVSDNVSAFTEYVRDVSEQAFISGQVLTQEAYVRAVSAGVGVQDAVSKGLSLTISEAAAVSGAVTKQFGAVKAVSESVGLSDSISSLTDYVRALNEAASVSAQTAREVLYSRTVSASAEVQGSVTDVVDYVRTQSESFGVSSKVDSFVGRVIEVAAGVGVQDTVESSTVYERVVSASAGLKDSVVDWLTENVGQDTVTEEDDRTGQAQERDEATGSASDLSDSSRDAREEDSKSSDLVERDEASGDAVEGDRN